MKDKYKKLISDAIYSDVMKETSKLHSVFNLINSDNSLTYRDRQDLIMFACTYCLDAITEYKDGLQTRSICEDVTEDIDYFNKLIDETLLDRDAHKPNFSNN